MQKGHENQSSIGVRVVGWTGVGSPMVRVLVDGVSVDGDESLLLLPRDNRGVYAGGVPNPSFRAEQQVCPKYSSGSTITRI